jgi:maltose alpha-D-glucosyltransferase/alpha-amylase
MDQEQKFKFTPPTNAEWWKKTVIYSTYVDKFAGDFANMTGKLDYLGRLGVDCVHILPFYPSPFVDDGYDISDYCDVRKELGTIDDFTRFAEEAHRRGIRVMIDLVLNHTSTQHPWFKEASSSPDNEKRNFYLWSGTGNEYAAAANPFSVLKSSNWIANPAGEDYYFSTFYPEQADLNWNNTEVFAAMMGVIDFWTARGVDGFRLDAAAHLIKKEGTGCVSLPETHIVLKRIRAYIEAHHPGVALLGEAYGGDPIAVLKTYFGDGDECHMMYEFPLVGKLFLALKRGDRSVLDPMLAESAQIPQDAQWATLLRHHDEMPLAGLPEDEGSEVFDHFDAEKKYKFNLGTSMRTATMFKGDQRDILRAFELLFSVPGSPIIYYGDEIGMENILIEDSERDTRRSVRGAFDWAEAGRQLADPASLMNGVAAIIGRWRVGTIGAEAKAKISAIAKTE